MTSGKIAITSDGQALSVDGVDASWTGDPATGAGRLEGKVSNIAIPEAVLALLDQGGLFKQLGYKSLSFDVSTAGELTSSGEALGYSFDIGIAGRDMGALKIGATLDAIPAAVYSAIIDAQMSGKEPDYTALMPQIQNIVIGGGSIRFEDDSITRRSCRSPPPRRAWTKRRLWPASAPWCS